MAEITVTDTPTEITDGTETTDTIVSIGMAMRFIVGDPSGRTYGDAMPAEPGQKIIVPAGVIFNLVCAPGRSKSAWKETGFSA